MPSFSERTQFLKNAISWWLSPSNGKLRGLQGALEDARMEARDPLEMLNENLVRLWPIAGSLKDPRWHVLSHSGTQVNTDEMMKAHWRAALVIAWIERAPDRASAAWARSMILERCNLEAFSHPQKPGTPECEEAALQAAVLSAASLEDWTAKPLVRPESHAFNEWAMGLAIAMGWVDEIELGRKHNGSWSIPGVDTLLWIVLFDRDAALKRMIDDGRSITHNIERPTSLFPTAKMICLRWASAMRSKEDNTSSFFPDDWNWQGFGVAHWVASSGAQRCLEVLLPQGIALSEQTKTGTTAALVCMKHLHPAMAAGMIEHGGVILADCDKSIPYRMMAEACGELEQMPPLRASFERAMEAMIKQYPTGHAEVDPIANTISKSLEGVPSPLLLDALVRILPDWASLIVGGVAFVDRVVLAAHTHSGAGILGAMAGGNGPALMHQCAKTTPWGLVVAAVEPGALPRWLSKASGQEKMMLAKAETTTDLIINYKNHNPQKNTVLVAEDSCLLMAILRSQDPVAGLGAVMQDSAIGPVLRADANRISRAWALAMELSDQGQHHALKAVVEHLPSPQWPRDFRVPQWGALLSKPRNEALVEKAIRMCPVQVYVDEALNTPLHMAVKSLDASAVQWLAAAGAEADAPNREGQTPRQLANQDMLQALAKGQAELMQTQVVAAVASPVSRPKRF